MSMFLPDDLVGQDAAMMSAADSAGTPVRLARGLWTAPQDASALTNAVISLPLQAPNQFSPELSPAAAYAACGPAAAIVFAQAVGRYPTLPEAVEMAKTVGWNTTDGMAGVASEQALLHRLGVSAHVEQGVNWDKVAQEIATGNPVIINSPGHYFAITAFDPQNGKFYVGNTGTAIIGGKTWLAPSEFAGISAKINTTPTHTLYMDSPHATLPSYVAGDSPMSIGGTPATAAGPYTAFESQDPTGILPGAAKEYIDSPAAFADWLTQSPQRMADSYTSVSKYLSPSAGTTAEEYGPIQTGDAAGAPLWKREQQTIDREAALAADSATPGNN